MAVKIKLKRLGKIRAPYYRIVVADSRTKRDGRAIEEIGMYHPTEEPSLIEVDSERAQYWLGVGAQPTEPVAAILKVTGDWQKFKGLPGAEGTLRTAGRRPTRRPSSRPRQGPAGWPKGDADPASGGQEGRAAKAARPLPRRDRRARRPLPSRCADAPRRRPHRGAEPRRRAEAAPRRARPRPLRRGRG